MKKKLLSLLFDAAEILVMAILIIAVLYAAGFRHAQVSGSSMERTLQNGEHLILSNFFYQPKRGDIVVINQYDSTKTYTDFELSVTAVPLVKRVIGLGGDTVRITEDEVYVNGEKLDEPYAYGKNDPALIANGNGVTDEITVPKGCLFVMGDHRDDSADSRFAEIGYIKEENIMGKAIWRLAPFGTLE